MMYRTLAATVLTLIVTFQLANAGPSLTNTDGKFMCNDGNWIDGQAKCNGTAECRDESDEAFKTCHNMTCNYDDQFRCNHGGCIKIDLACNGIKNCADGSDENQYYCANDTYNEQLLAEMLGDCEGEDDAFACDTRCLKWSQVCNGHVDCEDRSDESEDLCGGSKCPVVSFRCENGACISAQKRCNHVIDCFDGSDEYLEVCDPSAAQRKLELELKIKIEKGKDEDEHKKHEEMDEIDKQFNWAVNGCKLTPYEGLKGVYDAFNKFTYKTDVLVPDTTVVGMICNHNYTMVGSHYNKCYRNEWTGALNVCIRLCNQKDDVRNVRYTTRCEYNGLTDCNKNRHIQDTKLTVSCAAGYEAVGNSRQVGRHSCSGSGNWTTEATNPRCEPICGIKSPQHPDITPWTVSIFKRKSNSEPSYDFKCLGTILSPYIVLTAKKCMGDSVDHLAYYIAEGKHSVSFKLDDSHGYDLHTISNINVVRSSVAKSKYNAVLLTLIKPFSFGGKVRPVCLDTNQVEVDEIELSENDAGQQLGEGVTEYADNKYTLTHFVSSKNTKFDVRGFIARIDDNIRESERNP